MSNYLRKPTVLNKMDLKIIHESKIDEVNKAGQLVFQTQIGNIRFLKTSTTRIDFFHYSRKLLSEFETGISKKENP